jgi:hypothetical protein
VEPIAICNIVFVVAQHLSSAQLGKNAPTVEVVYQESTRRVPDLAFRLCIDANGDLADLDGKSISNDQLGPLLRELPISIKPNSVSVKIVFSGERPSPKAFEETLGKILKSAPRDKKTVVYAPIGGS